ncbi:MAG: ADP-ribosylation factor-like protein [Promethearchaeota archaeon]
MISRKKIILVGPPGVGKTTLQNVYFEHKSPSSLLKDPLHPSRGINSRIYTTCNIDLGVFDLAGQENEIWFSDKGKIVFSQSNIIICVFDIRNSLESIIRFLINIYKLKKELHLHSCKIIAFLHKIDLRSYSYVCSKLKTIQKFIKIQHPRGRDFEIYSTSITRNNFYNTFYILSEILNIIFKKNIFPINDQELEKLQKQLSIIYKSDINIKYNIDDISQKYCLNSKEARDYLEKLEELGFVKSFDKYNFFKLTNRADYFKFGLEKDISNIDQSQFNKKIEFFHIFLCLKEKEE